MRSIWATAAILLSTLTTSSYAHSTKRNPLNYISRLEDPVVHTPSHRIHAYSSFDLTFALHDGNEKIRFRLEPNHDIISEDTHIQYLNADGTTRHEEALVRADHRVFRGDAFVHHAGHGEWIKAGWARVYVHRDGDRPIFDGAFRLDGSTHHIQTSTDYEKTQHPEDPTISLAEDEFMVVWRDSDVVRDHDQPGELKRQVSAPTCRSDSLDFNTDLNHPLYRGLDLRDMSAVSSRALFGRQTDTTTGGNSAGVNLAATIGSTEGCPTSRKVALVGIATDCTYTAAFNSTASVRANIIKQVNSASQVYESSFNVSLGIQNLTISNATCPGTPAATAEWNIACNDNTTITDRLNLFSKWRSQFNDTNAYWTLLSTCGTDAAVGLAWLGQLCTQGSPDGSNGTTAGANVVVRTSTEWQVFAHETGHTFGAVHDCVSTTCSDGTVSLQQCCPLSGSTCDANGQFIMNPSTGNNIDQFSACSVGNICSALGRNSVKSTCLTNNKNVVTITGSQCGNGIVEPGEDCDCGGTSGCNGNSCCDGATCKFKTGAVCDPSNEDCCTSQCQFSSSGTVCRASTGSCDPAETCSGTSPNCPADSTSPDGQSCGTNGTGLTCASGQCTSRDLQCKTIVGALTTNNDTYACNSQGCLLSCASSQLGPNTCYNMQQYFLDGTPCQGGGNCQNGQCVGSNFAGEVGSWLSDNKNIVIPVASVIGGLVLIAVASCCFSHCRRRRARKNRSKAGPIQPPAAWSGANLARPAPAASRHPRARGPGGGNFAGPPPAYIPANGAEQQQWRVPTTRYA